jgi:uncharacterized membrane protein YhaH (DUF805 family)
VRRAFLWIHLVLATLVVVGIFVQVYLIASYSFGAGTDALDAHTDLGGVVHLAEVLVFLAAIGAYWKRWWDVGLSFALAVVGTIQLGFADGDEWVGGLHGLFALIVLVLATIASHRSARALGLGRHGEAGPA